MLFKTRKLGLIRFLDNLAVVYFFGPPCKVTVCSEYITTYNHGIIVVIRRTAVNNFCKAVKFEKVISLPKFAVGLHIFDTMCTGVTKNWHFLFCMP